MHVHFKPSDIHTIQCVVNNITRSGSAFAVAESGDQVFIPVRLADQSKIDIGDSLTCFAIDMHLDERVRDEPSAARYRCIRMRVDVRLGDVLPASSIGAELPAPPPAPVAMSKLTVEEIKAEATELLRQNTCWTAAQISQSISDKYSSTHIIPEDMRQKVTSLLAVSHDSGKIAACKIMASGDAKAASVVYYAKSVKIFEELLDYEVDAE